MDHMALIPPGLFQSSSKEDEYGTLDHRFDRRAGSKSKEKRTFKGRNLESYGFYLFVGVNADGELEYQSSVKDQGMCDAAHSIVELYHKKKHRDRESIDDQQDQKPKQRHRMPHSWPEIPPELRGPYMSTDAIPYPVQTNSKRRRVDSQSSESSDVPMSAPSSAVTRTMPSTQHGSYTDLSAVPANGQAPVSQVLLTLKVSEREKWMEWFTNAFLAIQQQYCRLVAKEWIRVLHPKKQSTHPYNGKIPRNQKACPNRTKPPYWPFDVQHKEPDHIDKDSRTRLLVHIIMHTPQKEISPHNPDGQLDGKEFTAEGLLEPLRKKKEEFKDKWWIIEEVIRARVELELYEADGCDYDQEVTVLDFEDHSRNTSKDKKQKGKPSVKDDNDTENMNRFNESRGSTPLLVDSPVNSVCTPVESENEDHVLPMNASFTSASTQTSTRSAVQILRPKPKVPSNNHVSMVAQASVNQHPMLIDSGPTHLPLDYDQPDHANQAQPSLSDTWTSTSVADSGMNQVVYANEMMMSQQPNPMLGIHAFQHPMYAPTRSHSMQVTPYHGSSTFPYDYSDGMRAMSFRSTPNLEQMMAANEFPPHELYMQAFANHQPPRH